MQLSVKSIIITCHVLIKFLQQNDYTDNDKCHYHKKYHSLIIPSQTQQSTELSLHTYNLHKKEKSRMGPNGDQTVIKW